MLKSLHLVIAPDFSVPCNVYWADPYVICFSICYSGWTVPLPFQNVLFGEVFVRHWKGGELLVNKKSPGGSFGSC